MSEEQRKEGGQELAAEKTESLTEAGQTAEDAFLPDTSEKAIEREPQPVKKKISRNKKLGVLAAVAVVLAVLAVGLGIYNKPENRLARQLDLGERYLEEQNYAEAVLAFEKAIQIDERCMAAYVNGIEAYRHLDEPENLLAFYEKALGAARSLEGEDLTADMDAVVSIYLAAEDVYTDREALIALWEEGYEKSGQDGRVRDSLVGIYLERAEERASNGAYEDSLQDYDRLLELDGQNGKVLESLTQCLRAYIDILMEAGEYSQIRELAQKYGNILPDFGFASILERADRGEQIIGFLQKVYDLMAAEDYEALYEIDQTEEVNAVLDKIEGDREIYIPSGKTTGMGIYRFEWNGEQLYYYYYGNYQNGIRTGQGVSFISKGNYVTLLYSVFSGQWENDAPNGKGKRISHRWHTFKWYEEEEGILKNGLWDGKAEERIIVIQNEDSEEVIHNLSYTVVNGFPEDKTEDYLISRNKSKSEREDWEKNHEGRYVYGYDDGTEVNIPYGNTYGIWGFADFWE